MVRVKIKAPGCFRTPFHAKFWCRTSSHLNSLAAAGYSLRVVVQIARNGKAASMIKLHDSRPGSKKE